MFLFILPTTLLILAWFSFHHSKKSRPTPLITKLAILLVILLAASTFFSVSFLVSLQGFLRWLSLLLILVIVYDLSDRNTLSVILISLIAISLILSFSFLLIQLFSNFFVNGSMFFKIESEHNQLAYLLTPTFAILTILYLFGARYKKILFISSLVIGASLLFSFARGAWFSASTTILFFVIFTKIKKRKFAIWLKGLCLLFFISTSLVLLLGLTRDVQGQLFSQKRNLYNLTDQKLNLFSRLSYFRSATKSFSRAPFFGTGLDTFEHYVLKISDKTGGTPYAHNFILQMLSETGIFTTLVFLALVAYMCIKLTYAIRATKDPLITASLAGVSASLFYSMFDFGLNYNYILIFILVILVAANKRGVVLQSAKEESFLLSVPLPLVVGSLSLILYLIISGPLSLGFWAPSRPAKPTQQAIDLYLTSLRLFPLNRNFYLKAINYFDQYRPEVSKKIINLWLTVDFGNGDTHRFLAQRAINNSDLKESAIETLLTLSSPFNRDYDVNLIKETVSLIRNDLDRETVLAVYHLLEFVERFHDNSFENLPTWTDQKSIFGSINILAQNRVIKELDFSVQQKIYKWNIEGILFLDTRRYWELAQMSNYLSEPNTDSRWSEIYRLVSQVFSEKDPDQDKLEQLVYLLESQKQDSLTKRLLSLCYLEQITFLTKSDINAKLRLYDQAIKLSPLTGSTRISKIKFLIEIGRSAEANQALVACEQDFRQDCAVWYLNYLQE